MRTPAGIECKYFYGDYHRGRNHEQCRLLINSAIPWKPSICKNCPIPAINRSNACEFMVVQAKIEKSILTLFKPQVQVSAFCEKSKRDVKEPHIGCGECHPKIPLMKY